MSAAHSQARHPGEGPGDAKPLLDELQGLLERQVRVARQGNLATMAVLMEEADAVVAKVVRLGVNSTPEFEQRRGALESLFDTLSLVLTTARSDVDDEIKRMRRGKNVLGTYRRNLVRT